MTSEVDAYVNSAIAALQCDSQDWTTMSQVPLNTLASKMYRWETDLWQCMVPHEGQEEPASLPQTVIRLDRLSRRVFAHHHAGRDAAGLRFVLTLNLAHFSVLSEIQVAGLVLHLLLHCFEELTGRDRSDQYHSAWFQHEAGKLGIPCPRFGCSCAHVAAGSPFMEWACRSGLSDKPLLDDYSEAGPVQKRIAWMCNCRITGYFPAGVKVPWICPICHAPARPKTPKP